MKLKLDIDRKIDQGDLDGAIHRVKFCLDHFEKDGFKKNHSWQTTVTKRLTLEEVIGALVSAEQQLNYYGSFPDVDNAETLKPITMEELLRKKFPCRYCNNQFKFYVQDLKEKGMIREVCGVHVKQFRKSKNDKILWDEKRVERKDNETNK